MIENIYRQRKYIKNPTPENVVVRADLKRMVNIMKRELSNHMYIIPRTTVSVIPREHGGKLRNYGQINLGVAR